MQAHHELALGVNEFPSGATTLHFLIAKFRHQGLQLSPGEVVWSGL